MFCRVVQVGLGLDLLSEALPYLSGHKLRNMEAEPQAQTPKE